MYTDWKEYQEKAADFFRSLGCSAKVEAPVKGVRATHNIDVWVEFVKTGLNCKWVIECKLWKNRVPKEKILTLKSIVDDVGADKGIIISEKGFQSGAYDAANGTNIVLITSLEEFQKSITFEPIKNQLILSEKYNEELAKLYTFPTEERPSRLLYHKELVYVANWASGTICIINPHSKTIVDRIDLDNYQIISPITKKKEICKYSPGNIVIASNKIFIVQQNTGFILVVDIDTKLVVKRIVINNCNSGELTVSSDEKYIFYSSNTLRKFFIINSINYELSEVWYPGDGRGSLSIFAHPNNKKLYIGIQRGGLFEGKQYFGGNSFLAVYNLLNKKYEKQIYLAEITDNRSDDSTPICITYCNKSHYLYVGMFQSKKGIIKINTNDDQIIGNISFALSKYNKHFEWVDPLAQFHKNNFLFTVNRNNREVAVIDKRDDSIVKTIYIGEAPNGPRDIVVTNEEIVVSYPEKEGLIFVKLEDVLPDMNSKSA